MLVQWIESDNRKTYKKFVLHCLKKKEEWIMYPKKVRISIKIDVYKTVTLLQYETRRIK